jgi:hypothetical protein
MSKLERILSGERLVVSGEWLDTIDDTTIATCYNRNRVGTKDLFVAYRYDNPPEDLEFLGFGYAVGSAD